MFFGFRFNKNVINKTFSQIKFYSEYKPLKIQKTFSNESLERNYARQVMQSREHCALFDVHSNRQNFKITAEKVIAVNAINEFENDYLVQNLSKFARKQTNAKSLIKWDQKCIELSPKWTIRKTLYVLDIWYYIRGSFDSNFVQTILSYLLSQIDQIHLDQAMQALTYLGWIHRKLDANERERVQYIFRKIIDKEELDVLSVWNIALFRTETDLDEDLLETLYHRLINEDINQLTDIGFNSFIKVNKN